MNGFGSSQKSCQQVLIQVNSIQSKQSLEATILGHSEKEMFQNFRSMYGIAVKLTTTTATKFCI